MVTGNDRVIEAFSYARDLSLQHRAVSKFQKTDPLCIRTRDHWAEWCE